MQQATSPVASGGSGAEQEGDVGGLLRCVYAQELLVNGKKHRVSLNKKDLNYYCGQAFQVSHANASETQKGCCGEKKKATDDFLICRPEAENGRQCHQCYGLSLANVYSKIKESRVEEEEVGSNKNDALTLAEESLRTAHTQMGQVHARLLQLTQSFHHREKSKPSVTKAELAKAQSDYASSQNVVAAAQAKVALLGLVHVEAYGKGSIILDQTVMNKAQKIYCPNANADEAVKRRVHLYGSRGGKEGVHYEVFLEIVDPGRPGCTFIIKKSDAEALSKNSTERLLTVFPVVVLDAGRPPEDDSLFRTGRSCQKSMPEKHVSLVLSRKRRDQMRYMRLDEETMRWYPYSATFAVPLYNLFKSKSFVPYLETLARPFGKLARMLSSAPIVPAAAAPESYPAVAAAAAAAEASTSAEEAVEQAREEASSSIDTNVPVSNDEAMEEVLRKKIEEEELQREIPEEEIQDEVKKIPSLLDDCGLGLSSYFKLVKSLAIIFFLMSIVTLPNVITFSWAVNTPPIQLTYLKAINSQTTLALSTITSISEIIPVCRDAEETMQFTMTCPKTYVMRSIVAYYGQPSGSCGCPNLQQVNDHSSCDPMNGVPTYKGLTRFDNPCCSSKLLAGSEVTGNMSFLDLKPKHGCDSLTAQAIAEALCQGQVSCTFPVSSTSTISVPVSGLPSYQSKEILCSSVITDASGVQQCQTSLSHNADFTSCELKKYELGSSTVTHRLMFEAICERDFVDLGVGEAPLDCATITYFASVLNAFAIIIYLSGIACLRVLQDDEEEKSRELECTASDFTICCSTIPKSSSHEPLSAQDVANSLQDFFESKLFDARDCFPVEVLDINLATSSTAYIKACKKRGAISRKIDAILGTIQFMMERENPSWVPLTRKESGDMSDEMYVIDSHAWIIPAKYDTLREDMDACAFCCSCGRTKHSRCCCCLSPQIEDDEAEQAGGLVFTVADEFKTAFNRFTYRNSTGEERSEEEKRSYEERKRYPGGQDYWNLAQLEEGVKRSPSATQLSDNAANEGESDTIASKNSYLDTMIESDRRTRDKHKVENSRIMLVNLNIKFNIAQSQAMLKQLEDQLEQFDAANDLCQSLSDTAEQNLCTAYITFKYEENFVKALNTYPDYGLLASSVQPLDLRMKRSAPVLSKKIHTINGDIRSSSPIPDSSPSPITTSSVAPPPPVSVAAAQSSFWANPLDYFSKSCLGIDEDVCQIVHLKRAPEPTEIVWENAKINTTDFIARVCLSGIATIFIILFSYLIIFEASEIATSWQKSLNSIPCETYNVYLGKNATDYAAAANDANSISYLDVLKDQQPYYYNFTSVDTGLGSYGYLQCYCQALLNDYITKGMKPDEAIARMKRYTFFDGPSNSYQPYCNDKLFSASSTSRYINYISAIVILFVNTLLDVFIQETIDLEGHMLFTGRVISKCVKMFISQFLNTALLSLIIAGDITQAGGTNLQSPPVGPFTFGIFTGSIKDYNNKWYTTVGASLMFTMCVFTIGNLPGIVFVNIYKWLAKRWDRRWTFKEDITHAETQESLDSLNVLPAFPIENKYAAIMCLIFVDLLYSPTMPLFNIITFGNLLLIYVSDKITITHFYSKPPQLNQELPRVVTTILFGAAALHCANGVWMWGNTNYTYPKVLETFVGYENSNKKLHFPSKTHDWQMIDSFHDRMYGEDSFSLLVILFIWIICFGSYLLYVLYHSFQIPIYWRYINKKFWNKELLDVKCEGNPNFEDALPKPILKERIDEKTLKKAMHERYCILKERIEEKERLTDEREKRVVERHKADKSFSRAVHNSMIVRNEQLRIIGSEFARKAKSRMYREIFGLLRNEDKESAKNKVLDYLKAHPMQDNEQHFSGKNDNERAIKVLEWAGKILADANGTPSPATAESHDLEMGKDTCDDSSLEKEEVTPAERAKRVLKGHESYDLNTMPHYKGELGVLSTHMNRYFAPRSGEEASKEDPDYEMSWYKEGENEWCRKKDYLIAHAKFSKPTPADSSQIVELMAQCKENLVIRKKRRLESWTKRLARDFRPLLSCCTTASAKIKVDQVAPIAAAQTTEPTATQEH